MDTAQTLAMLMELVAALAREDGECRRAEARSAEAPDMSKAYERAASMNLPPEVLADILARHEEGATRRSEESTKRIQSRDATVRVAIGAVAVVLTAALAAWTASTVDRRLRAPGDHPPRLP